MSRPRNVRGSVLAFLLPAEHPATLGITPPMTPGARTMHRLALALSLTLLWTAIASAQALTPDEAVKRMKLPEGFSARAWPASP